MINSRIGLIGSGNIGSAFIRGWLKADPSMAPRITVTDAVPAAAGKLSGETGVGLAATNAELAEKSDLVLLAVKPGDIDAALAECAQQLSRGKVLVSVAAGRTIASLEKALPDVPVFRIMPNVAVEVCAGTISLVSGAAVDRDTEEEVINLFSLLGRVIPLPENLFAAATAIGGSGPGFMALLVDAFVDAGVMAGLPSWAARELTFSMFNGAAKLLSEGGLSPSELRRRVTSPAGTTAAGIAQLERDGARSAIIDAVQAALRRANELG